jgi:hypothetical protein
MSKEDWMLEWIQELVRSGMPVENAVVAFNSKIGDVDRIDETTDPKAAARLMVIQQ